MPPRVAFLKARMHVQSQVLKAYIRNWSGHASTTFSRDDQPVAGPGTMAKWTTAACRRGLNQGGVGTGSEKGSSLLGMQKPLCPQPLLCSRWKAVGGIRLAQQKETRALEFPSSPLEARDRRNTQKSLKN